MDTLSLWSALDVLLPAYPAVPMLYWPLYLLAGTFGSLVRISYLDKPLRGFYRDGKGQLRMGFYAEIIVGVAVALIVDGHPIRAGVAAIFAPQLLGFLRGALVAALESTLKKMKR